MRDSDWEGLEAHQELRERSEGDAEERRGNRNAVCKDHGVCEESAVTAAQRGVLVCVSVRVPSLFMAQCWRGNGIPVRVESGMYYSACTPSVLALECERIKWLHS